MEIITGILAIGLIIHSLWREWLSHRERIDMARVYKAKDLSEVEYVFSSGKVEENGESSPELVSLGEIPDNLGVEEQ